jgi:hypothetical protein
MGSGKRIRKGVPVCCGGFGKIHTLHILFGLAAG